MLLLALEFITLNVALTFKKNLFFLIFLEMKVQNMESCFNLTQKVKFSVANLAEELEAVKQLC